MIFEIDLIELKYVQNKTEKNLYSNSATNKSAVCAVVYNRKLDIWCYWQITISYGKV
jgi:hypothetical protein